VGPAIALLHSSGGAQGRVDKEKNTGITMLYTLAWYGLMLMTEHPEVGQENVNPPLQSTVAGPGPPCIKCTGTVPSTW
jgi:hypothetical protein